MTAILILVTCFIMGGFVAFIAKEIHNGLHRRTTSASHGHSVALSSSGDSAVTIHAADPARPTASGDYSIPASLTGGTGKDSLAGAQDASLVSLGSGLPLTLQAILNSAQTVSARQSSYAHHFQQQNAAMQALLGSYTSSRSPSPIWITASSSSAGIRTMFEAPPEKDIYSTVPYAGVKVGEVIGWRGWLVNDGKLKSMSASVEWDPGDFMVGDIKHNHFGCYAWKTRTQIEKYLRNYVGTGYRLVIGEVRLWGEVIEHQDGYRAELAKPISLYNDFNSDPVDNSTLQTLRNLYLVDKDKYAE